MNIKVKYIEPRKSVGRTWVSGTIDQYSFCALIFREHAIYESYELSNSRISKLELNRLSDGEVVYAWDRGPGLAPADSTVQEAVENLSSRLYDIVFKTEKTPELGVPTTKFPLGRTVITPNALCRLAPEEVQNALSRHHCGDWGNVCKEDRDENDLSLKQGFRLLSAYESQNGDKFWVITESDRSATTVLMPEDY